MKLSAIANIYNKFTASEITYPIGLTIDITRKCNTKCKHCYFRQQKHYSELSDKEWLNRIKKIKKAIPTILTAEWIGGEPLLRKKLIEQGMKYFPINVIVTNGIIKLPKWTNCNFRVSVDGTKKYYEKTREKNIYEKIKKNINRDDVDVVLIFTINKKNAICIEKFLDEWSATRVQGVALQFYTPINGIKEDLWVNRQQRDIIINQIINLKGKYKNFILNDLSILELMKSQNVKEVLRQCVFRNKAYVSLDPNGRARTTCTMGENADCYKCVCIAALSLPYFKRKKIKLSPNFRKMFP